MSVRPWHTTLGCLVAGLLAGPRAPGVVFAGVVAVTVAAAVAKRPALGLLAAVALVAGAALGEARSAALARTGLRPGPVTATVTLVDPVRAQAGDRWSAAARLHGERVALRGRGRAPAVAVGDVLAVRGRLRALEGWEGHERARNAHAALEVESLHATGRRRGGLAGGLDKAARRAGAGVGAGLRPSQAALARGMVLGRDEALDTETRDAFRDSGLAHHLAASGTNVTLVALLAMAALAAAGAGRRVRIAGALALIAAYVPLAGAGPSIQRAGVMGAAGLVAALAGRPASRAYALLLAAAVTLTLNPRAPQDVGWQLSFAAVITIALLAPRWAERLRARRAPGPLADALALTMAATVGTAPLLALHFESVSVVSLPANVVAAPAVAPVVWLGTVSAALGQLGAPGAVAASAVNAVNALPLGFVAWVAHTAAAVPHATVAVALGGALALLAAYAGLGALAVSRRARLAAAGAVLALAVPALAARAHPPQPPRDLTLSFLEIGQGDATLIQHGERAILIDTGPRDGPIIERLRESGARRLDALILSHLAADHDGAAERVLDELPVGTLLDGRARLPPHDPVSATARRRGTQRIVAAAGQRIMAGPIALRVLWPPPATHAISPDADPNDRAVVTLLRAGDFSALLTADAESGVTLPLRTGPVDVLKVAHHGSADPGLPALLERLRPASAVISVGPNTYGHPHVTTLAALRGVPRVWRTDRDGTVHLTAEGPG